MRGLLVALLVLVVPGASAASTLLDVANAPTEAESNATAPLQRTLQAVHGVAQDLTGTPSNVDPPLLDVKVELPIGPVHVGTQSQGWTDTREAPTPHGPAGPDLSTIPPPVRAASLVGISLVVIGSILAFAGRALGLVGFGPLFSRILGDRVLEHPIRAQICHAIQASPGLTMSEICERAGIAWGTAVHHLRRLERNGLLVSVRGGSGRLFFIPGAAPASVRMGLAATVNETAHRIARFVLDHPGTDQQGLCAALGLRNPAASKHLRHFEALGLISATPAGRHRIYQPTRDLASALANPLAA